MRRGVSCVSRSLILDENMTTNDEERIELAIEHLPLARDDLRVSASNINNIRVLTLTILPLGIIKIAEDIKRQLNADNELAFGDVLCEYFYNDASDVDFMDCEDEIKQALKLGMIICKK